MPADKDKILFRNFLRRPHRTAAMAPGDKGGSCNMMFPAMPYIASPDLVNKVPPCRSGFPY